MNVFAVQLCFCAVLLLNIRDGISQNILVTTDELENHISPEDLQQFLRLNVEITTTTSTAAPKVQDYADIVESSTEVPLNSSVDCFGLGSMLAQILSIFNMNMTPDTADKINTHFYFSSREKPKRVQVYPGKQFGLEWVDFKPQRKTVMIIHGFMSHGNASWVIDMTNAFLKSADVNVISVDWSGGGNTWKYWRAVANTRRVGSDVHGFLRQLIMATGARVKDFHLIGHSLGAHIASYVSYHLGGVSRITGLDPAQPCFTTTNSIERLDPTDADFVDIIHTNGRMLSKIGLGLPEPAGHADFYPNGGMKQPGCNNSTQSIWARYLPKIFYKLEQAVCSHGRAYLLFTESLLSQNCSFRAHRWNLTYDSVNASLIAACDLKASCSEMGINADGRNDVPKASGPYFVLTAEKEPYCPSDWQRSQPQSELLRDLRLGFRLDSTSNATTTIGTAVYADPLLIDDAITTTTPKPQGWFARIFGK